MHGNTHTGMLDKECRKYFQSVRAARFANRPGSDRGTPLLITTSRFGSADVGEREEEPQPVEIVMNDVTRILSAIDNGDPFAAEELLPLVYDELRKLAAARLANESPDHTLQATALVHEAYVRLVDRAPPQRWDGRGHFFAAAAEAMRRILVDSARRRLSLKRGGHVNHASLDDLPIASPEPDERLVALSEALEKLQATDKTAAELVKLRYFAGFSGKDAASSLGLAERTAERLWVYARSWLLDELTDV